MKQKKILKRLDDIKQALRVGPVFASTDLLPGYEIVVSDVRRLNSRLQVLTLEGWRTPSEVWTNEEVAVNANEN
jgi:hypothetical protein